MGMRERSNDSGFRAPKTRIFTPDELKGLLVHFCSNTLVPSASDFLVFSCVYTLTKEGQKSFCMLVFQKIGSSTLELAGRCELPVQGDEN